MPAYPPASVTTVVNAEHCDTGGPWGMWLLVSGSQVRLKRMPGKARELSIFTEGSGETQELCEARVRMLAGAP